MSPIQFKLAQTGPGAIIRLVTFAEQPSWFALASRVESLYGIPLQDVGVSYTDTDGDVITLSTHEELLDYYATVPRVTNNAIKFTVKNLGAQRAQQRTQPQQPMAGVQLFDPEEGDWHFAGIPVFPRSENPPPLPPKSPSSAFVETVDSHVSPEAPAEPQYRSVSSSPVSVQAENANGNRDNVSEADDHLYQGSNASDGSSVSVLHDDTPDKQPIHVYGSYRARSRSLTRSSPALPPLMRSSRSRSTLRSYSRSRSRSSSRVVVTSPPRRAVYTPSSGRSRSPSPHPKVSADPPSPIFENLPVPDPPLPAGAASSHRSSPTTPLPSLTKDVADLLTSLTNAFGSHPELSEGLKNIVRNASLGAYWAAERDAMVNNAIRAAESAQDGIARAAEQAQEEAGRKVTEALDGVFRALGGILGSSSQSQGTEEVRTGRPATREERSGNCPCVNPMPAPERIRSASRERPRSPSVPRTIIIPRSLSRSRSPHYPEHSANRPSHANPVGTPPPIDSQRRDTRPLTQPFPYPFSFGTRHHHRHWFPNPPPPPPPGPAHARHPYYPGPPVPPPHPSGSPQHGRHFAAFAQQMYPPNYPPPWGSPYPPPPGPQHGLRRSSTLPGYSMIHPLPPTPSGVVASNSSSRKAQLEEAKRYYKEQKEEWRREKETRRKEKEQREAQKLARMRRREMRGGRDRQVSDVEEEARPPVPPHPAELMAASSSQGALGGAADSNDHRMREAARREQVLGRLAAMGFTLQTHPQLENHVNKHLRSLSPWENFDVEEIIQGLMTIYGPLPAAPPYPQDDYTNQRSEASRRQQVFARLAAMGFTLKTHPQLEILVAKHLRRQSARHSFNAEEVIAGLMEDLFHPQGIASGPGTRIEERMPGPNVPIPGAWNM